jgi:NADH:ubiquinone oxidoreductase subunit 5 (subunit L)/multisubunit Na+/H+ antiporter MnhA subunit
LIGGILNLPFASSLQFLDRFLKPVIAASPSYMHVSGLSQVVLGTLDGIFAIGGGLIAYFIWSKTYDKPSLEFTFLKNAWYIDKSGDVLIARSSTKLAEVSDGFIEPKVIDGAVVGISKVVVALGILIRKSASGFVRREAAVIAAGLVVILIIGGLRGGL